MTENGASTGDIMEAHLNRQMIDAASKVTVLAELNSFGRRSLALVTELERVNRVICDRTAPENDVAMLRARGVEVVLV
jgi:DeoR family transcriptional regulator of aga operon